MFKPEILAPGGSFNTSIHAFEAGADAVYIGMSSFSARKGAKNFTLDELRRLKSYAVEHNKKIFVALNTILKEQELDEMIHLLHHLFLIRIDAVILQDPGLAYIIKNFFPQIEIHASTQMAVHNADAVEFLKNEGFSRIILARELSLSEIRKIRELHRDVELEVFIHGAMCYSFSGICLASGTLLGRSGNRGECGQICRTWFESSSGNKYQFSANDLKAGTLAKDLQKMGINSLKIEGRLKNPEYVSHTVSYYRSLLDNKDKDIVLKEETLSELSFSRNQTTAFFNNPKGENMINNRFASHTGIPAGKIISAGNKSFVLKSETDLSDRDGLLIINDSGNDQFALKSEGKKSFYKKGESLTILYSGKIRTGITVYKISGHNLQLKEFNDNSWKPWKSSISVKIILEKNVIYFHTSIFNKSVIVKENISFEKSRSGIDIIEILRQNLSKSGLSIFNINEIDLENKTGLLNNELFIPLSHLKGIKNLLYKQIESEITKIIDRRCETIRSTIKTRLNTYSSEQTVQIKIPPRSEMNPFSAIIPFTEEKFQSDLNKIFFPLPPLLFGNGDFEKLEKNIEEMIDKDKTVIIGLNNVSHFRMVQKYKDNKNIFFFTDYCTYIANSACELFYRERIERLLFSYYWIEDPKGNLNNLRKIEPDFTPHLFVSRICYKKHNNLGSCENCTKDLRYELKQKNRDFTVIVKDCITWLF